MKYSELLSESVSVLTTNKLRTSLSALGIVIGISSVIALVTLGEASKQSTLERISTLGSNLITIRPGSSSGNEKFDQFRSSSDSLTYKDFEQISADERLNTVDKVSGEYSLTLPVSSDGNKVETRIYAVTKDYFEVRGISIAYGSKFLEEDFESLSRTAILGTETAADLFGDGITPIGQEIKIKGSTFRIIGLTEEKGGAGPFSMDEGIYIPITTAQKTLFGTDFLSNIYVTAKNSEVMDQAENQLGFLMMELHEITSPDEADFSISSSQDLLETVSEVTSTFTTLLAGIAAISLVVGGIGIMNIMMVTVTERTREIGVRRALGAKRSTITKQFLTESVILTSAGGILGVILGVVLSLLLTKVMGLPQVVSYGAIFLAVAVSCIIGTVFGWYPAQKASKLQPVEALRYE
jgi:putative ABC transport system permease protein